MNLQKMSMFIILLSLSIDSAKAADHDKGGFDPYLPYAGHTTSYNSYSQSYPSNFGVQTPLTEQETEYKKLEEDFRNKFRESFYIPSFGSNPSIEEKIGMITLETEFKTWENMYRKKFHTSFYCADYQASKAKKIEMIKEELKLKDEEDAYSKKFSKDFSFSQRGIETSYRTQSTAEKLRIITEEREYQDLFQSYFDEFQEKPSISDAAMTTDTTKIKANQIEALKGEIEIQRLIRDLKSAYPDITDEYLKNQYSQLPVAENGIPTRIAIIEALRTEKQRRERR
ncbi:MAG: hypothetical protein ACOH2E_00135 [Candidatus Paracaedibacter sp.]